jgi:KaiC/GvpD/RAD55 family RecA-like ATPase
MSNQQMSTEELRYCKSCGSVLLKYVDFDNTNNKNTDICCNCSKTEPTDKNIVNATPYIFDKYGIRDNDAQTNITNTTSDKITNLYFKANGKPSSINVQLQYNKQLPNEIKQILNQEIEFKPPSINEQAATPIKRITGKIIIDWTPVIGYQDIKNILDAVINNTTKKKTHTLIAGAPGTSKTVFLKTIETSLRKQGINVHYLDATTLSSSGVIQYMFDNEIQFCLLDELDKLEKEHQKVFLNLLESGILQETKFGIGKNKNERIRKKDCKDIIVIATANYIEKIIKPLKTRFLPLNIHAYTKQQFYDIGVQLLTQQYNKSKDISYYIVDQIWNIYAIKQNKPPNLRQAVQVATLTTNDKSSIDPILNGLSKYSQEYEE